MELVAGEGNLAGETAGATPRTPPAMNKTMFQVPALWRERLDICDIASFPASTDPIVYGLEHVAMDTGAGNRAGSFQSTSQYKIRRGGQLQ